MSVTLECVLVIFLVVLVIVLIVLCIYIAKLLEETTETMRSIRELTQLAKKELTPALKSINSVLKTVDDVSLATNRNFSTAKKVLTALVGASLGALGKGGFFSGLISGFNLFKKRR